MGSWSNLETSSSILLPWQQGAESKNGCGGIGFFSFSLGSSSSSGIETARPTLAGTFFLFLFGF